MTNPVISQYLYIVTNWSLLFAFFALPTSRALLNFSLAVFLVCMLFFFRSLKCWMYIRSNPITLPLALIFFIVLVGCSYSSADAADIGSYLYYYSKLLIAICIIGYIGHSHKLQIQAVYAFTLSMLLSAAVSGFKWLDFISPRVSNLLGPSIADHAAFKDYLIQNVMMGMFCLVSLSMLFHSSSRQKELRIFWTMSTLFSLAALFVFVQRGRIGQLGFLTGAVFVILFALPKKRTMQAIATLVLGLILLFVLHKPWQENIVSAVNQAWNFSAAPTSSVGNRIYLYSWAITVAEQRSLFDNVFGNGTASYPILAQKEFTQDQCSISCPHPHSQFIFLWIEYGLVGLVLFFWLLWRLFQFAIIQTSITARMLALGFFGVFTIDSAFHSSLWLRMEGYFSVLMIALITSFCLAQSNEKFSSNEYKFR